jgi:hypothetical protein
MQQGYAQGLRPASEAGAVYHISTPQACVARLPCRCERGYTVTLQQVEQTRPERTLAKIIAQHAAHKAAEEPPAA